MADDPMCPRCGAEIDAASGRCSRCDAEVGTAPPPEIEGYEFLGRLGEGGMGAVFLARDKVLDRKVAIKIVSRRIAGDPQSRERFLREARTLATVEHPNVVRVYSFGQVAESAYLVLEYIEGETLSERISRGGPLDPDDAIGILRQVVQALDAAHDHGIVHRDIKPSNILLSRRGTVSVADFGLAKPTRTDETSEAITQTGYMLGTPHYVSPEQAVGKRVDFRSDIYSLGIVLYEMLTAQRPFDGTTPMAVIAKSLNEPLPDIREKRKDLSRALVDLITWMTAKDPQDRPDSYSDLLQALLGQPRTTVPVATTGSPASALRILGAGAAVGLVLGTLVLFLRPTRALDQPVERAPDPMAVAVCPFWGPDDVSSREGRVMAALVERSIEERLGSDVSVLGIDRTGEPVRSHEDARALGSRLGAGVVVWGEAITLRDDTEILPSFTLLAPEAEHGGEARDIDRRRTELAKIARLDLDDASTELATPPLRLSADAPDQIQMRRMSAEGVGDMVTFLSGLQSLQANDAERALTLFQRSTPTADVLRNQAEALVQLDRTDEAIELLRRALELEPDHASAHARLADILWIRRDEIGAIEHYRFAVAGSDRPRTLHATLHQSRLFAREVWEKARDEIADSGYLIVMDPATRKVLERHYMPGQILSFESGSETLTITWTERDLESPQTLVWSAGGFDRPTYPGGNLLRRMIALRSGVFSGFNFIQGVWGPWEEQQMAQSQPRYTLPDDPALIDDLRPASYESLETWLLSAIERDPTQPWHLFHLGWVQKMTSRQTDSLTTWARLMDGTWPGVPYSEFAWMAKLFERLGEREWADRAFDVALSKRSENPQEPAYALMIERLIVSPVVRIHESVLDDSERAYEWLQRTRELTGQTEGDRVVSAVWEEWFLRQGDESRAAEEAAYQKEVLGIWDRAPAFDYLIYALVTLSLSFCALLALTVTNGIRRARISQKPACLSNPLLFGAVPALASALLAASLLQSPRSELWQSVLAGTSMFWLILITLIALTRRRTAKWTLPPNAMLTALWLGSLALCTSVIDAWGTSRTVDDTIVLVLLPLSIVLLVLDALFRLRKTSWAEVVSGITHLERRITLSLSLMICLLGGLICMSAAKQSVIASMPIGLVDSLGHPQWTRFLDEALEARPGDNLRYTTAVAHHLQGDFERATTLYKMLPRDDRVEAGLAAAGDRLIKVTLPRARELLAGLTDVQVSQVPTLLNESDVKGVAVAPLVIGLIALSISGLLLTARPRDTSDRIPGRAWRLFGSIVPGFWWIRAGRVWSGTVALILLIFLLLVTLIMRKFDHYPAPGVMSAMAAVSYDNSVFPLPGELTRADIPNLYRRAIFYSYPGARAFVFTALLALVALVVMHVRALRDIWKRTSALSIHDAETAVTPSSPEEIPTRPIEDSDATAIKPRTED